MNDGNGPFYIDGKGGQLGDRGTLGESNVLEVKDGSIITDKEVPLGEQEYTIDMERRKDIQLNIFFQLLHTMTIN